VVPVDRLVEQLRSYVLQRCSHNCKKNIIESILPIILIKNKFCKFKPFSTILFQFNANYNNFLGNLNELK
jgi:hypothetical protein